MLGRGNLGSDLVPRLRGVIERWEGIEKRGRGGLYLYTSCRFEDPLRISDSSLYQGLIRPCSNRFLKSGFGSLGIMRHTTQCKE